MHENDIAHRDIKTDNILLQNTEGDPMIIDFGLANADQLRCGTASYMAPEQIKGKRGKLKGREWWIINGWDQRLFDAWSLGCVIKKCFTGFTIPDAAQSFINMLMKEDASTRMTVHQALNHHWLATKPQRSEEKALFD